MESIYNFSETQMLIFALVFLRIVGFIVAMPVIGTTSVPVQVKVLFSMLISFILMPMVEKTGFGMGITEMGAVFLAIKEVFIGLVFGFLARMFFLSLSMAGQIISVSLGVSAAQLFNPAFNENSSAFDQFFIIIATLFFFAINGHHLLLSGLVETYQIIPVTNSGVSFVGLAGIGDLGQMATEMALKFSAPILITILFTNFAMGIMGRAVPQINILITSLPVNTLVGLLVLFLSLPLIIFGMENLLSKTMAYMFGVLKTF